MTLTFAISKCLEMRSIFLPLSPLFHSFRKLSRASTASFMTEDEDDAILSESPTLPLLGLATGAGTGMDGF